MTVRLQSTLPRRSGRRTKSRGQGEEGISFFTKHGRKVIYYLLLFLPLCVLGSISVKVLIIEAGSLHHLWNSSLTVPLERTTGKSMRLSSLSSSSSETPGVHVDMEMNSTKFTNDIESIIHFVDQSMVKVRIRSGATCPHPYLMGRLSGPALAILDKWSFSMDDSTNSTILSSSYSAPMVGRYFVEIIVVFCNDFAHSVVEFMSLSDHIPSNLSNASIEEVSTDFGKFCMEDIETTSRLTSKNASIDVVHTAQKVRTDHYRKTKTIDDHNNIINNNQHINDIGYWWNEHALDASPLFTRKQPRECWETQRKRMPVWCRQFMTITSRELHSKYVWRFDPVVENVTTSILSHSQSNQTTICLVGLSHSRVLHQAMELMKTNGDWNIETKLIDARYPTDVTGSLVEYITKEHGCNHLLIGVGQWPPSWKRGVLGPTLFDEYSDQIRSMIETVNTHKGPGVKVWMRGIHYNAPHIRVTDCPPADWRSPPVIDGYNAIISRACSDMAKQYGNDDACRFISSHAIWLPFWDSAKDYCHFEDDVTIPEARYIAAQILQSMA